MDWNSCIYYIENTRSSAQPEHTYGSFSWSVTVHLYLLHWEYPEFCTARTLEGKGSLSWSGTVISITQNTGSSAHQGFILMEWNSTLVSITLRIPGVLYSQSTPRIHYHGLDQLYLLHWEFPEFCTAITFQGFILMDWTSCIYYTENTRSSAQPEHSKGSLSWTGPVVSITLKIPGVLHSHNIPRVRSHGVEQLYLLHWEYPEFCTATTFQGFVLMEWNSCIYYTANTRSSAQPEHSKGSFLGKWSSCVSYTEIPGSFHWQSRQRARSCEVGQLYLLHWQYQELFTSRAFQGFALVKWKCCIYSHWEYKELSSQPEHSKVCSHGVEKLYYTDKTRYEVFTATAHQEFVLVVRNSCI